MSILIENPAGVAAGGAAVLAMLSAFVWRFGIECERAWLRAEAAGPEHWELEMLAHREQQPAHVPENPRPASAAQGTPSAQHERGLTLV
jgi:hypothetical protein